MLESQVDSEIISWCDYYDAAVQHRDVAIIRGFYNLLLCEVGYAGERGMSARAFEGQGGESSDPSEGGVTATRVLSGRDFQH